MLLPTLVDTSYEDLRDQSMAPFKLETRPRTRFHELFGDMPIEDAMLDIFCQDSLLRGRIYWDNMADSLVHDQQEVRHEQEFAYVLGTSR